MKRVATAAVMIPIVLALVFRGPSWLMPLVLAALAIGCIIEFERLAEAKGIRIKKPLLRILGAAPFLMPFLTSVLPESTLTGSSAQTALAVVILAPFCFVVAHMLTDLEGCFVSAGVATFGVLYISIALLCLWLLWAGTAFGSLLIFFLLVVVWSGDISAYYVGKNFGRRKLAPRISPGKTWEGAVASFVISVSLGTWILVSLEPLYFWLYSYALVPPAGFAGWGSPMPNYPWWFAVAASAVVNIAAQLGDLVESALKRSANVKDSGAILPGHGGLLDRIDALLFAGPAAMLVFAVSKRIFPSSIIFF
ncbi:MAG: phosphatidate cytidylyltransferase [Terriglobales bacterium]